MGDSNFKITYFRYLLEALSSGGGGGGVIPYNELYREAPPERTRTDAPKGFLR